MFLLFLDWSSFQIMTLFSGELGFLQQASQVIVFNWLCLFSQIPYGYSMATCTLIGIQIGAGNVSKAKKYFRISTYFTVFTMVIEFIILFLCREYVVRLFSADKVVIEITNEIIWVVLIVIA